MRGLVVAAVLGLAVHVANAHVMRFETDNSTFDNPQNMVSAQLAKHWFATIQFPGDVDYYIFEGEAGEEVSLHLMYPWIEGHPPFYPSIALIGPGLPQIELSGGVRMPEGAGAIALEFSEEDLVEGFHDGLPFFEAPALEATLPQDGTYYVVIWHPLGEIGRYTFEHGDEHGGLEDDPDSEAKLEAFWTPLQSSSLNWELYN